MPRGAGALEYSSNRGESAARVDPKSPRLRPSVETPPCVPSVPGVSRPMVHANPRQRTQLYTSVPWMTAPDPSSSTPFWSRMSLHDETLDIPVDGQHIAGTLLASE